MTFTGKTLSGKTLSFPGDYAGKIVLVDFWATWCGPCQTEIPHLVDAHEKYGDNGLEIIGVSLDDFSRVSPKDVAQWTRDKRMPWEHIYGGAQEIAMKYGVATIPALFLVDGSTGEVLATGDALRGSALAGTIRKHLPAPTDRPNGTR